MLEAKMMELDVLLNLPRNPKLHALAALEDSMQRWGFVDRVIINNRTQHIISGNGRVEDLKELRQKESVPENVSVQDGAWLVPVDIIDIPESEELPLAVALNNLEELGGWDNDLLSEIMLVMPDITGTGFTIEQIQKMTGRTKSDDVPPEYEAYTEFDTDDVEGKTAGDSDVNLSYLIYVSFSDIELFKEAVELFSLQTRSANMEGQRFVTLDGDEFIEQWRERLE